MSTITVLLTGGGGFVGSAILDALLTQHPEYRVVVADAKTLEEFLQYRYEFGETETHHAINGEEVKSNAIKESKGTISEVEYIQTDVRVLEDVEKVVATSSPTIVIHTAGIVPGGMRRYSRVGRDDVYKLNVQGTQNLLDTCSKLNATTSSIKGLVHTSSCTVITDDLNHDYPNMIESVPYPTSALLYGESKAAAERLVLSANTELFHTCALRPSTICGPADYQLIPSIHACIAKHETPFIIGDGDNLYDFTYVTNVADAHVLAVENLLSETPTAAGKAIFIQNNEPITFRDFCLFVWVQFDHIPPYSVRVPRLIAWIAGALAELITAIFGGRTTLCRGSVCDGYGTRYASGKRAREILGYEARVSLDEGIRKSCKALKRRLDGRSHLPTRSVKE